MLRKTTDDYHYGFRHLLRYGSLCGISLWHPYCVEDVAVTVAVKIQVPEKVNYQVVVRLEQRDLYHKTWNTLGTYTVNPGETQDFVVYSNVRIVKIEEVPLDASKVLPTNSRSIVINEDAHGG